MEEKEKNWESITQRSDSEREKFIMENTGLVWSLVKRFQHREKDSQELFQIGCVGLIKATDRFQPERNIAFSTFAVPYIVGEIKKHFRDNNLLHVSRELKQRGWEIQKAKEKFIEKLGRSPRLEELAEITNLTKEEVVVAMEANLQIGSIDEEIQMEDGSTGAMYQHVTGKMGGVGKLEKNISGDEEKEGCINHLLVKELLQRLKGKERRLILLRYYKEETQSQIAKKMGMTQVQVCRMEKKVLRQMEKWANQ